MNEYDQYIEHWLSNGANEPWTVLWLGGLSFLLGLTHTLGPGHGKSLLLGVLVAESRRVGHALKMAMVIGITHMADVILLSIVSIALVASFSFQSMTAMIGWISGLALVGIGCYRLWRSRGPDHEHDHDHSHANAQPSPTETTSAGETENLWAAFFYSLAPCPGAWVLFTACLGLGKPIYGLYLLLGFTLGLLTMISLLALSIVYSTRWLERLVPDWVHGFMSVFSGLVIVILGVWILVTTVLYAGHPH